MFGKNIKLIQNLKTKRNIELFKNESEIRRAVDKIFDKKDVVITIGHKRVNKDELKEIIEALQNSKIEFGKGIISGNGKISGIFFSKTFSNINKDIRIKNMRNKFKNKFSFIKEIEDIDKKESENITKITFYMSFTKPLSIAMMDSIKKKIIKINETLQPTNAEKQALKDILKAIYFAEKIPDKNSTIEQTLPNTNISTKLYKFETIISMPRIKNDRINKKPIIATLIIHHTLTNPRLQEIVTNYVNKSNSKNQKNMFNRGIWYIFNKKFPGIIDEEDVNDNLIDIQEEGSSIYPIKQSAIEFYPKMTSIILDKIFETKDTKDFKTKIDKIPDILKYFAQIINFNGKEIYKEVNQKEASLSC